MNTTTLITTTDIEFKVNTRNQILQALESISEELQKIVQLEENLYGGSYIHKIEDLYHTGRMNNDSQQRKMNDIMKSIDARSWNHLLKKSNYTDILSNSQKEEMRHSIQDNPIEFTIENILTNVKQWNQSKESNFLNGVIDVFKCLSWDYKNNQPYKIGKKIIMSYACDYNKFFGFSGVAYKSQGKIFDLERILHLHYGLPLPTCHNFIKKTDNEKILETDFLIITMFQNRNIHIQFKNESDKNILNNYISKAFGDNVLAPKQ